MVLTKDEFATLSKLLDEALDLPPAERDAWLERLPDQHTTLRATLRELLSHAGVETDDFLKTLPKLSAVGNERIDLTLQPGALVGAYRLVREIGCGGMSSVWLAERVDGVLKRSVALKLPFVHAHRPQFVERFIRERDILAGLTHPNIARLYDAGVSQLGQPYLAMEYIEGVPLIEHCDAEKLNVRQRLQLFKQVLAAMQYAHSQLVIHRDLKPSNILVTAQNQVALLDFGIAKLTVDGEAKETELTQFGGRVLTLNYASPEQINGQTLSTASDVYSLGVVLYELLTGTLPYKIKRDSRGALEDAILSADPPKLGQSIGDDSCAANRGTTMAKLAKILRVDLDTIVQKALRKSPSERYETAQAFAADIERYLNQQPVLARPNSRRYVAMKFIARHRIVVGIGVAAFSAVLVAAAVALFEASKATTERDHALQLSERNGAVTEFLKTIITEAAQSNKPVTVNDMLMRSEQLAATQYANEPDNRAAVLSMLGEYYFTIENISHADELLNTAKELTRNSTDWNLHGRLLCYSAMFADDDEAEAKAVATLRRVVGDTRTSDELAAQCLPILATYAAAAGHREDALRYSFEGLTRVERLSHPPVDVYATVLDRLARSENQVGRTDLANKYFDRAMQLLNANGRERSAIAKTIRGNWAGALIGAGDQQRALKLLNQSLSIVESAGADAPADFVLLAKRAQALYNVGRFSESMASSRSCLEHVSAGAVPWLITCQLQLVVTNADADDLKAAHDYLAQATATFEKNGERANQMRPLLALARARMSLAEHRGSEALELLNTVVTGDPLNHRALRSRAEGYLAIGDLSHAETDARAAIVLGEKLQGGASYSNQTGLAWLILGRVLEKQNQHNQAQTALQAAITHLSNTVDVSHPALLEARKLADVSRQSG
ncbi:MAG TPA: serine/threonine-protein kinase [Steroidobacteraceae bacterium]|nr:serine/threonine-protein kinase [Steroidobacteraceae bacterium]